MNTFHRRQIGAFVKMRIEGETADQIEHDLLSAGFAPCVAREWATEPRRRIALAARRDKRMARKRARRVERLQLQVKSGFKAASAFKRIIATKITRTLNAEGVVVSAREVQWHATKGLRNSRIAV